MIDFNNFYFLGNLGRSAIRPQRNHRKNQRQQHHRRRQTRREARRTRLHLQALRQEVRLARQPRRRRSSILPLL